DGLAHRGGGAAPRLGAALRLRGAKGGSAMGTLIARLTSRRAIIAIGVVALLLFAGVARAAPLSRWFSPQPGATDQAGSSGTPGARGRAAADASPLAGQAAATASPGGTPAGRRPAPQTPAGPATPRNTPMPT